ncbi:MAG: ABC transporter permease [Gemmatimonadota bacterium]
MTEPIAVVFAEVRQALRVLVRRPGFTFVAVLTLALGIGANTAVFSVFHSVLLRPLPYPEPDRLVAVDETWVGVPGYADGTRVWASYRSYATWRDRARSLDGLAATQSGRSIVELGDAARSVGSARVSANYFDVVGAQPVLGRGFSVDEMDADAPVVVLSEGLWEQAFAADPGVLGRSVVINGASRSVVGVMPDGYRNMYTGGAQLWTPLHIDEARWLNSDARWLRLIGRLPDGGTLEASSAELTDMQLALGAEFPETHGTHGAVVRDLHSVLVRSVDERLRLLLAAVGLVLLIATINVGALLFARTLERSHEWQLRVALGAGRLRLLRTHLTEATLLALAGGTLGVFLAQIGVRALSQIEGGALPAGASVSVDGVALGYAALVTVGSALLFAVVPAWRMVRQPPTGLRVRSATTSRGRETLVVVESALAVVVLVALGLALRSYDLVLQQDPGFEPDGLVTFRVPLPEARYPSAESERAFYEELRLSLTEVRGVSASGAIDALPLEPGSVWPVFLEDRPDPPAGQEPQVYHRFATAGVFDGLGVEVLAGRDFSGDEYVSGAPVAVVDSLFAERFWPGEDPLGRRVRHFRDGPWLTVIGVVGSTAQRGLEEGLLPTTYAPGTEHEMSVVVRSDLSAAELLPGLRQAVSSVDAGVPVEDVRTGAMVVADDTASRRFDGMLLLAFGIVGLTLVAIGTYGTLSALVVQRRMEIGVRRALGATGGSVVRRVLSRTLFLASTGLAVGLFGSVLMSRMLEQLVFSIPATDLVTYAGVVLVMLGAATLAGLAPAVRAAAISPLDAIRGDGRS